MECLSIIDCCLSSFPPGIPVPWRLGMFNPTTAFSICVSEANIGRLLPRGKASHESGPMAMDDLFQSLTIVTHLPRGNRWLHKVDRGWFRFDWSRLSAVLRGTVPRCFLGKKEMRHFEFIGQQLVQVWTVKKNFFERYKRIYWNLV